MRDYLFLARAAQVRWRALLTGTFLLLAVLRLALLLRGWEAPPDLSMQCQSIFHAAAGESLMRGTAPARGEVDVSWNMPAYSVSNALVCRRDRPILSWVLLAGALTGCTLLVFGLGRLVSSDLCGAAAAWLFLGAFPAGDLLMHDRWFYVLTVTAVAFLLVWRDRHPTLPRSLLLGAGIGMSLLVLSPLFLFPAAVIAFDLVCRGGDPASGARVRLGGAAALIAVPALMLLPWIWMNWQIHHRVIPLENGRADSNMMRGAAGLVTNQQRVTIDSVLPAEGMARGESAFRWAAREVIGHPGRYLRSCLERFWFAFAQQPLLSFLALAVLVVLRRRRAIALLGLLAAYYVGLHCTMTVQEKYFFPIWPVVCVLAAGLCDLRRGDAGEDLSRERLPRLLGAVVIIPLALLQGYALACVLAYPGRLGSAPGPDQAVPACPSCPSAWTQRGMERLRQGRTAEAAADLGRAFALDPGGPQASRLAWALLVKGVPLKIILGLDALSEGGIADDVPLLEAFHLLQDGRLREAGGKFAAAWVFDRDRATMSRPAAGEDQALQEQALAADHTLEGRASEVIAYWPLPQRLGVLKGLRKLALEQPDFFIRRERLAGLFADWSAEAERSGLRGAEPQIPRWIESLRTAAASLESDAASAERTARRYWELGEYDRLAGFLDRRGRQGLAAGPWLVSAREARKAGRREPALQALAVAASLELDAA
ncbi:MAG: hypothetical protein HY926_09645, partial [Elusimicrobia bacterium]|nr:hypothetical protein [Elusimicrobiota bacterium]